MVKVYGLSPFMPSLKGLVRDVRVVWTMEELAEQYERIELDALKREHKTAEYLKLNPFGKVPVLQDGDFTLFESLAICTYLGDKHNKLIPKPSTKERALYNQWTSFAISTFEPPCFRVFGADFFTKPEDKNATVEKIRSESLALVDSYMGVMDTYLSKNSYLLGDHFSITDVIFSSSCRILAHTKVSEKYKNLSAYLAKNFERPAFKKALALHD